MRVKQLLASHYKLVPANHFGDSDDALLSPPEKLGNDGLRSAVQRKIHDRALESSVLYYQLDISRCQVALLKDLPENNRCLAKSPTDEELEAHWVCVSLIAASNRIRSMAHIAPPLSQLRLLDLSVNYIDVIDGLDNLPLLTSLNLSHNRIAMIDNLSFLESLTHLDLSFNQLTDLEDLDGLNLLQSLRVNGNKIDSLEGLDDLPLVSFEAYSNKIEAVGPIVLVPTLQHLNLGDNDIKDLKETSQALQTLSHLTSLILQSNPIEKEPYYRMQLMNATLLQMDNVNLTPQFREHVQSVRTEKDLEKLVKATSEQYGAMISQEEERKRKHIRELREQEEKFEKGFAHFRRSIENELEEAIGYVETLKAHGSTVWTVTDETLVQWKRALRDAEAARRLTLAEDKMGLRNAKPSQEQLVRRMVQKLEDHYRSSEGATGLDEQDELRHEMFLLSKSDPEAWRQVKILEVAIKARKYMKTALPMQPTDDTASPAAGAAAAAKSPARRGRRGSAIGGAIQAAAKTRKRRTGSTALVSDADLEALLGSQWEPKKKEPTQLEARANAIEQLHEEFDINKLGARARRRSIAAAVSSPAHLLGGKSPMLAGQTSARARRAGPGFSINMRGTEEEDEDEDSDDSREHAVGAEQRMESALNAAKAAQEALSHGIPAGGMAAMARPKHGRRSVPGYPDPAGASGSPGTFPPPPPPSFPGMGTAGSPGVGTGTGSGAGAGAGAGAGVGMGMSSREPRGRRRRGSAAMLMGLEM